jgi:histidine triad (HIT) family protein
MSGPTLERVDARPGQVPAVLLLLLRASPVHRRVAAFTPEGSVVVEGCLFCGIVAGEVDADVVHVTEHTVAFRDIAGQAPTHVLVVPRDHYANAAELAAGDPVASAELVTTAAAVATAEGHEDYRLVFNTGAGVGQSVFHTHLHLLAGRPMTWPPG